MDSYTVRVPRFCIEHHADGTVEVFVHASLGVDQRYAHMARLLHIIAKDDVSWRVVNAARVTASGALELLPDAIVRDDGRSGCARLSQLAHTVPHLFAEGLHARFRLVPRTVAADPDEKPMLVVGPMVWSDTGRALYELERLRLLLSDADKAECYCTVQVGRYTAEGVKGTELRAAFDRLRAQWAVDDDGMGNATAGLQVVVFVHGQAQPEQPGQPEQPVSPPALGALHCSADDRVCEERDGSLCAVVFDDDGNASPVRKQTTRSSNPVKDIYARTDRRTFFNVKPVPSTPDNVSASAAELRQLIVRARKDNPDVADRNAALFEYAQVRLHNSMTVSDDPVSRGARDIYETRGSIMPPKEQPIPLAPCSREPMDDNCSEPVIADRCAVDDEAVEQPEPITSAIVVDGGNDNTTPTMVQEVYARKNRDLYGISSTEEWAQARCGGGNQDPTTTAACVDQEHPPPPPPESPTLADMIRSLQRQPYAVRVEDCDDDDDDNDDGWSSP